MAVVLAAFDDSMKEVLALVNKTAYKHNISMHGLLYLFIVLAASHILLQAYKTFCRVETECTLFGFLIDWQHKCLGWLSLA